MRICTCLWGGLYNPIIPVSRGLPSAWKARHRGLNGSRLAQGYVRFFEPDVYVEAAPGLASAEGIRDSEIEVFEKRVIALDDFVDAKNGGIADFAFGQNIFELYRHLFEREFQFTPKHDRRIARVTGSDHDAPFVEAILGAFPDSAELSYIERGFHDAFDPEDIPISAATWRRVVEEGFRTPFYFTRHGIERSYESSRDSTIFIFDPSSTIDLIDVWNLRQFQQDVLPVSVEWITELRDFLRARVEETYRPLPGNPHGVMIHTTVEFARSIEEARAQSLASQLFDGLPQGSWATKPWYEALWHEDTDDFVVRARRVKLTAEETNLDLTLSEGRDPAVRFNTLSPEFADRFGSRSARWVNVLAFRALRSIDDLALTLPSDFPELGRIRIGHGLLATREGFVLPLRFRNATEYLRFPRGSDAIAAWLNHRGIAASKSDPGRIADQILVAANGFWGSYMFEDKETLELLDKMAKSIRSEAEGAIGEYPDRTASVDEWMGLVQRRKNRDRIPRVSLDDFVRAGALKLGLSLACENCRKQNWYSLNQLSDKLQCDRCLQEFAFPQSTLNFKQTPWRYRVAGPFSVPDFAGGAYSTVLALRTFARKLGLLDVSTTFSTNLDLREDGQPLEIDFTLWFARERTFRESESPHFVIGEAKSFAQRAIRDGDVQRMKRLASLIPGSFLAFAVLRGELSKDERDLLRKLAVWGRELLPNGNQRAPVIVLTGRELFAEDRISSAWKEAGGKAAALISPAYIRTDNLWTFADLTQQLYLDLDPFHTWLQDKWERKRRHLAPQAKGGDRTTSA